MKTRTAQVQNAVATSLASFLTCRVSSKNQVLKGPLIISTTANFQSIPQKVKYDTQYFADAVNLFNIACLAFRENYGKAGT